MKIAGGGYGSSSNYNSGGYGSGTHGSYGGGMYGNSMYRGGMTGGAGSLYGGGMYGGGMYNSSFGGAMGGYGGMGMGSGMGMGMGMGGPPYGDQDPNNPFAAPSSPPGFWVSFMHVVSETYYSSYCLYVPYGRRRLNKCFFFFLGLINMSVTHVLTFIILYNQTSNCRFSLNNSVAKSILVTPSVLWTFLQSSCSSHSWLMFHQNF